MHASDAITNVGLGVEPTGIGVVAVESTVKMETKGTVEICSSSLPSASVDHRDRTTFSRLLSTANCSWRPRPFMRDWSRSSIWITCPTSPAASWNSVHESVPSLIKRRWWSERARFSLLMVAMPALGRMIAPMWEA